MAEISGNMPEGGEADYAPVRIGAKVLAQASPLPTPAADGLVTSLLCDEYGRLRCVAI